MALPTEYGEKFIVAKNLSDPVEEKWNMNEYTVIYDSVEKYLEELNSDARIYPPAGPDEMNLLDHAFHFTETEHEKSKSLIISFLNIFLKPKERSSRGRNLKKIVKKNCQIEN